MVRLCINLSPSHHSRHTVSASWWCIAVANEKAIGPAIILDDCGVMAVTAFLFSRHTLEGTGQGSRSHEVSSRQSADVGGRLRGRFGGLAELVVVSVTGSLPS
jgi:hypothetical protein